MSADIARAPMTQPGQHGSLAERRPDVRHPEMAEQFAAFGSSVPCHAAKPMLTPG